MTLASRHAAVGRLLARGALLAGLLLAACDAALSGPPPPATPVSDPLHQELPAIRAAMARIQRFDLQRTSQPPQSATSTVYETAVDLPARQARWTVAATSPVPAEETIRVDDVVYSRAPAAALWIRSPRPAAYALPQDLGDYFQHNGLLPPAGDPWQYLPAGEETVSGVLCRIYRNVAPTPDPSGFGLLYNAAYWVGIADHIVYRSAVDSGGEAGIGHEAALLRVLDRAARPDSPAGRRPGHRDADAHAAPDARPGRLADDPHPRVGAGGPAGRRRGACRRRRLGRRGHGERRRAGTRRALGRADLDAPAVHRPARRTTRRAGHGRLGRTLGRRLVCRCGWGSDPRATRRRPHLAAGADGVPGLPAHVEPAHRRRGRRPRRRLGRGLAGRRRRVGRPVPRPRAGRRLAGGGAAGARAAGSARGQRARPG